MKTTTDQNEFEVGLKLLVVWGAVFLGLTTVLTAFLLHTSAGTGPQYAILVVISAVLISLGVSSFCTYLTYEHFWKVVDTDQESIRERSVIAKPLGGKAFVARDPVTGTIAFGDTETEALEALVGSIQQSN